MSDDDVRLADAEALRQAQIAEREALIEQRKLDDIAAHEADGPHLVKYDVQRKDQAENDPYSIHHGGCAYLVLDIDHDPLAMQAAAEYARACAASHPEFSADLSRLLAERGWD